MNLGFALEYALGHITHAQNLKHTLEDDPDVTPYYIDLPYRDMPGWWAHLPLVRSNWSVRASLGAYLAMRKLAPKLNGALFHTQVTSLFSAGLMRKLPSVVSLDATPIQYDALGAFYNHFPSSNKRLEDIKKKLNIRAFTAARRLVTWSAWAKGSLVADYGISADKITVIPPGIDTRRWDFGKRSFQQGKPVNLLFVGGDFYRKGGDTLLEAFRRLPASANTHLHIVTGTDGVGDGVDKVTVYRGLTPNSEGLLRRFADADIFVFPSQGDCLPLAIMEALASGLPIIATDVGALSEAVTHNQNGLIIPMGDSQALAGAIQTLSDDSGLRATMSAAARQAALAQFDAKINYQRLVETVKSAATA